MSDWLLNNTHRHRRHSAALEGSCRTHEHPNAHPNRRPKALAGLQGENERVAGTQTHRQTRTRHRMGSE